MTVLPSKMLASSIIEKEKLSKDQEKEIQAMNFRRRQILQLGIGVTGTFFDTTQRDLEVVERLAHALKKPTSIDSILLTHLFTEVRSHRKHFVLSKNSQQAMDSMHQNSLTHLSTLTTLLEQSVSIRSYQALCTLAGEASQLLGDISFHEGKSDAAEIYYDMALTAATDAQDDVLQAVILGRTGVGVLGRYIITINKWALGISDTLAVGLLSEYTGLRKPIVAIPCFKTGGGLDTNPAFARSTRLLRKYGVQVIYEPQNYPPKNQVPPQAILQQLHVMLEIE